MIDIIKLTIFLKKVVLHKKEDASDLLAEAMLLIEELIKEKEEMESKINKLETWLAGVEYALEDL